MVQVETVGELGIILILFIVGLDLSPDNLRKVHVNNCVTLHLERISHICCDALFFNLLL